MPFHNPIATLHITCFLQKVELNGESLQSLGLFLLPCALQSILCKPAQH